LTLFGLGNQLHAVEFKTGTMIRDAEVESILKSYLDPIVTAAGMNPERAKIYIIVDPELNASAGLGSTLFINTGFILNTDGPSQLVGVFAHEVGHISGGHSVRQEADLKKMTTPAMAMGLLGGALGLLAGSPDVATASLLGGAQVAQRSMLHYSRGREASADQAAVKYLDKLGWSLKGFLEFFDKIKDQELLPESRQNPYARTHPLTQERLDFVENQYKKSPIKSSTMSRNFENSHKRMKIKLQAYLDSPSRTLSLHKESDKSFLSQYARTIATYRQGNLSQATNLIDALLVSNPEDPYLWELKGEILFEAGEKVKAFRALEKALTLSDNNPLIQVALAHVLLEMNTADANQRARVELSKALQKENDFGQAWHFLAIAYGRENNIGMAALSLSEQALLGHTRENKERALQQAKRALHHLKKGTPGYRRATDIQTNLAHEEVLGSTKKSFLPKIRFGQ